MFLNNFGLIYSTKAEIENFLLFEIYWMWKVNSLGPALDSWYCKNATKVRIMDSWRYSSSCSFKTTDLISSFKIPISIVLFVLVYSYRKY